jgi:hypothetical protein
LYLKKQQQQGKEKGKQFRISDQRKQNFSFSLSALKQLKGIRERNRTEIAMIKRRMLAC